MPAAPRLSRLVPLALTPLILLGACSSGAAENADSPPPSAASSAPASSAPAPATSSPAAPSPAPTDMAATLTPSPKTGASANKKSTQEKAGEKGAASPLTLTVAGKKQKLAPTDVYCQGQPGKVRRAVAKTNNRPPLIEVDGERFLLVKTGRGKPFKIQSPSGVSFGKESVSFDGVSLSGGAKLDGTINCTKFED